MKLKQTAHYILLILLFNCSSHNQVELFTKENKADHIATGTEYVISTQGKYASEAGKKILEQGGNLMDAAIAVSFTLSVERPQSTGIGGGGFLLYHQKDAGVKAFDFRETAPGKILVNDFIDPVTKKPDPKKSQEGALAVATPGMVAGMWHLHQKYGKLPWRIILAPAIELADEGFPVYPELVIAFDRAKNVLEQFPKTKELYFRKNGEMLKEGDLFQQKKLAYTLRRIAKEGANTFYIGDVANQIAAAVQEYKGKLSIEDLRQYSVKERTPLKGSFLGKDIYAMPLPSSGGIHLLQILNALENRNFKKEDFFKTDTIHYTASMFQQAFADRKNYLGDSDFVKVPVDKLIDKNLAEQWLKNFDPSKAKIPDMVKPSNLDADKVKEKESKETTHFSIMDKEGNIIVSTQTINGPFGSGLIAGDTGIMLNNEMDDFSFQVGDLNYFGAIGGEKNLVQPRKRPLSSMVPTIIFENGKPVMGLGSPDGTRIITCVATTLFNRYKYGMSLQDAIWTKRYHQQLNPDELWIEEGSFSASTIKELEKLGHHVTRKKPWCKVQAVEKNGDELIGVADPRGRGMVIAK